MHSQADDPPPSDLAAIGRYHRPAALGEALALLATEPWTVVAGCTVYYLNPANRPERDWILDITGLDELARVAVDRGGVRIGALATWTAIAQAALPPACRVLQEAAMRVGSVQIRNAGTLGGNLCGAASTADGIPPLLALDAAVELTAESERRVLPLATFLLGSRRTAKRPDELLTAVHVPLPASARVASGYLKLTARAYQAPMVAAVAAALGYDQKGRIDHAAVALAGCSSLPRRLPALERRLVGRSIRGRAIADAFDAAEDLAPFSPIGDVRVTAGYRLDVAATLVRRSLDRLGNELA